MQSKTPASNVSFCFFYTSCKTQYIIFKFYYDIKVISKGIIIFANMKMSGSIWVQSLKHYGRCGYFEVLIYCESRLKYFVAKRQEMKCATFANTQYSRFETNLHIETKRE